jgi:hypothetical protein
MQMYLRGPQTGNIFRSMDSLVLRHPIICTEISVWSFNSVHNNEPSAITIIMKNKHELYHRLYGRQKGYYRLWEKYSRMCSAALSTVQRNDTVLSRLETVPFSRRFSCEGNIEYTWAAVVQNTDSYRLEHALIAILSRLDGGKVRGTCFEL